MKRILFVEDDPVVVTIYRARLEREGFCIEVAEDGLVAMRSLANLKPDLVVLDLMLPKVNGIEVLKYIRNDARLGAVPVVVLSNAYLSDMVKKAMLAGANKPLFKNQCTPAILLQAIRSFLPEEAGEHSVGSPASFAGSGPSGFGLFPGGQAEDDSERDALAKARAEFLAAAPAEMAKIRELCLTYIKSASSPSGLTNLDNLYQRVHFISARAGLTSCSRTTLLASAFEALLFEMVVKPGTATPSVLQTIAQATDCLRRLLEKEESGSDATVLNAKVLVVDDDAVCNHVMVAALKRVNLDAVGVKDPHEAVRMLWANPYDLVLLDIHMPGMDGFGVCKQLRRLAHQKTTPVVFVTANGEFENRVQSVLSGGNELITKPVSPMELAVKAITILLDAKIKQPGTTQLAANSSAVDTPDGILQPVVANEPAGASREDPQKAETTLAGAEPTAGESESRFLQPAPSQQPDAAMEWRVAGNMDRRTGAASAGLAETPDEGKIAGEACDVPAPVGGGETQNGTLKELLSVAAQEPATVAMVEEAAAPALEERTAVQDQLTGKTAGDGAAAPDSQQAEVQSLSTMVESEALPSVGECLAPVEPEGKPSESEIHGEACEIPTSVGSIETLSGPVEDLTAVAAQESATAAMVEEAAAPALEERAAVQDQPAEKTADDGGAATLGGEKVAAQLCVSGMEVEASPSSSLGSATEVSNEPLPVAVEPGMAQPGNSRIEPERPDAAPLDALMTATLAGGAPSETSAEAEAIPVGSGLPSTEDLAVVPQDNQLKEPTAVDGPFEDGGSFNVKNDEEIMQNEQNEVLDKIAAVVARVVFGDNNVTELNVRLVRIALERYNIPEMINPVATPKAG